MLRIGLLATIFATFATFASAGTVVTFNPSEIGGSISCCPPVTTEWSAFGITMSGVYWYDDSRDTFDTYGVSIENATTGGQILFATPTTLAIDYWVIVGNTGTYRVYDSSNNLLDSLLVNAGSTDLLGSYTFMGNNISKLALSGSYGFVQASTLRYDAGGAVPEPSSFLLLGLGGGALALLRRRA